MKKTILVVDDDRDALDVLKYSLGGAGYNVLTARDGQGALELAQQKPDLVVLDVLMPGMDGWEVCRRLKRDPQTARIPTLFLTARGSDTDELLGFELGADDYVVKPIRIRKLLSRINAVLRRRDIAQRSSQTISQYFRTDGLEFDISRLTVVAGGNEATLTKKEFQTLVYLATHPNVVTTRAALLDAVWGNHVSVVERTVDVLIGKVREKLGPSGKRIETVKGVGYRFRG
jgi:two-component system phosphate regulon response regulator PhoB